MEIGSRFGSNSSQAKAHFALNVPVYPAYVTDPMQTVTANGVEMLLQRIKVTPSFTKAYLCFQKPTQADWGIGSMSTMQIGEDTGTLSDSRLLFDAPGMGNVPKNRIRFDFSGPDRALRDSRVHGEAHGKPEYLL